MGSVKDLIVVKKPTKTQMGIGRFVFSDRYSVFDWGEMPDQIAGKGTALCMTGAYCFEQLEKKGIKTHYRGLVDEKGKIVRFDESDSASDTMEVDLVNVYRPQTHPHKGKKAYDYSRFSPGLTNYLIPLEIIYRNGLPEGSSIFKRLEQGKTTLSELGLNHMPTPGEKLIRPIFDVSTKLEDGDRYVTWQEAQKISGLTDTETQDVKNLLITIDDFITETAAKASLQNEDGKIELAFDHQRCLMTVDVVGTLDECRFTFNGLHVSKEIARQFYRKTRWFKDVEEAKKSAELKGIKDWKSLCRSQPPKLDPKLRETISQMYMAAANEMTGNRIFDVPPLRIIIEDHLKTLD